MNHEARSEPLRERRAFSGELLIWLSASFPTGAFAYSQGLEVAVARGWVTGKQDLQDWLLALAKHGGLGNDLTLLSLVVRAKDLEEIAELSELAAALQPSAERFKEACDVGQSFLRAYRSAWGKGRGEDLGPCWEATATLPVVVGLAAREYALDDADVLEAYAISFITNQISAAIRLTVCGQFDGQQIIASLLPELRQACERRRKVTVDDLGTATFSADIAGMLHETQTTRLFRS